MPTADFKKYTCYFNSGEDPKGMPSIYFDPTSAFQLEVKNIKLDEMTDDLLYGQNLLAWGDFEEDNTFQPSNKKLSDAVKIVDSANFMSGEKSLLLDYPKGKTLAVTSGFIPAIPGACKWAGIHVELVMPDGSPLPEHGLAHYIENFP